VKIFAKQKDNTDYICTEYEPIAYSKNFGKDDREEITQEELLGIYTLLRVKLITGKSHQIRAHLASIGHPIIGDYKYGSQKTNHYFKKNYELSSQLLHSYQMVFPKIEGELSYLSGKSFTAKLPEQFEKIKKDLF
jgi:23S rRNA pseudouridine955/2504/2580 synthase